MASTIYALIVGIDDYQPPVPPLHGCIADLMAMHAFLISRVGGAGRELDMIVLKNEEATRQGVMDGFRQHLSKAGPEDSAIFYFCGHGSQTRTAPEFYHLEPDRLDETLVCFDSRMPGKYDLADKEISKLIAEVAKKDPHIVVILDSCHSGSATRNLKSVGVRRAPMDCRQRPLSSYIISPLEWEMFGKSRSVTKAKSGWARLPKGKHIVLSACQSDEEAKEIIIGHQARGVFSFYLLEVLQSRTNTWTYRDLFARVNALVRAKVSRQSPLIEATDFTDLDRPFLGGEVQTLAQYFTASFDKEAGWLINGGTVHGIPEVQETEPTCLALFPAEAIDLETLVDAIGKARIMKREPTRSIVAITLDSGSPPNPKETYKAVITELPVSRIGVCLEGDEEAIKLVREALAHAGPNKGPSLLVREVTTGEQVRLIARGNKFLIRRAGDDRPLTTVVEGWSAEKSRKAAGYIEHIARWTQILNLNNPVSGLPANGVTMEIFLITADGRETPVDLAALGADLRLFYECYDGVWHEPKFKLKLTNNSNCRLYCMLFNLTERFKVWAENLLPGGGIWLDPGEEAWAFNGDPIPASVPDEMWKGGLTEFKDLLKLVAATEQCEASLFQQENLDVKYEYRTTRSNGLLNSLERLVQPTRFRDIGAPKQDPSKLLDWMTAELSITTVRPLEGTYLSRHGEAVFIAPRVRIIGHPSFKAMARLTTSPLAMRDMTKALQLPAWFRDDPAHIQAFDLSPSRNAEAGLSVLELAEVSDHTVVMPDKPLKLFVDAELKPEEHILPISYDLESDLYLPLGHASHTDGSIEIQIEHLPAPTLSKRSLTGSIKVFFLKIIAEKLGLDFEYPLLRSVDVNGEHTTDLHKLRRLVDNAERILLFIHGIIGDTRGMATSAFRPVPDMSVTPLGEQYDLVLTYDYENLNTTVQENARALIKQLKKVGLGENHGKILHIVAHSMGGLVSRWCIEREGGKSVVQHLVMLGTPNKGSPWPTMKDWVTGAIGLGLNGLTTIAWPVKVLGDLMSMLERAAGATLEQMETKSQLLKDLAESPDPRVRYTMIAGNTSLIAEALREKKGEPDSRIIRLFKKLDLQQVLHATASLAFFGTPNDIAVGVNSIIGVPMFEKVDPPREVACDHMTYFTTEAGLRALAEVLA